MKKILLAVGILFYSSVLFAQAALPNYPDSLFSTYYHQRLSLFRVLPQTGGDIIFAGNSITDGNEWGDLFNDQKIKNRGISGDVTAGIIYRIDEIAARKPAKVFLMIGVNDLAKNIAPDSVAKNMLLIADYLAEKSPATRLYIQSILPVNDVYGKFSGHTGKGEQIRQVNELLQKNESTHHYIYIDLHRAFCDEYGKLKKDLSNDGLHLKGEGYLLWKHLIFPFVYDLQTKPSLLPLPQRLQWKEGLFSLVNCRTILVNDTILGKEALKLKNEFERKGLKIQVRDNVSGNENYIRLQLGKVAAPQLQEEAYRLEVRPGSIIITANAKHGVFNGVQTLLQLVRDNVMADACDITDWPAFSWRGYMIDVGRNYQSMDLLKQQIDFMARHKLNIFHFHPTEDIAWRIAIKEFPQLTAPEHMLRNKGMFYSERDIKELIAYCEERYITFVPEIDMPGHSAAFKRAMKTDMQSDSGLIYVKKILKELCKTYALPYLHIGADEVKISNKNFVPAVTNWIQGFGTKVIGWQPGGNYTNNTIRQLWMDDNANRQDNSSIQYIDSRHLYLNHMDPLEAVVTIFNRRIGDKIKGDDNLLGGTLCMWHDRAVAKEDDVQRMNAVYPGILAFAERSWRGGGEEGWVASIGEPGSRLAKEFTEFENRLLDQQQHFPELPFPYARQSNIVWKLYGPYDNAGNLDRKFSPETSDINKMQSPFSVAGGTIIWRHWWAPLVKAVLANPKENSTWYASTKIWSADDGWKDAWIGFNNLSRSPATDSPKPGTWDNHQSKVWINGLLIDPPFWKRGGQMGNSEIPLVDEGYEYREPTRVFLKKGWNVVLIKSPIGSFKGKDWQNPEKWMFTFVPVH